MGRLGPGRACSVRAERRARRSASFQHLPTRRSIPLLPTPAGRSASLQATSARRSASRKYEHAGTSLSAKWGLSSYPFVFLVFLCVSLCRILCVFAYSFAARAARPPRFAGRQRLGNLAPAGKARPKPGARARRGRRFPFTARAKEYPMTKGIARRIPRPAAVSPTSTAGKAARDAKNVLKRAFSNRRPQTGVLKQAFPNGL